MNIRAVLPGVVSGEGPDSEWFTKTPMKNQEREIVPEIWTSFSLFKDPGGSLGVRRSGLQVFCGSGEGL